MSVQRIGIVFNGATGELAARQHLPALMAMRDEGGLPLSDGSRLMPDVLLVGRDPAKLAAVAGRTGFHRSTTDLAAALAEPGYEMLFDAAPSGQRLATALRGLAAGKHLYVEKPIAATVADALALHTEATRVGVKAGTVQDKLHLPGFTALLALRRDGFFGRVLEVRVEMGRWIHDGFGQPGQRPSWNYRRQDGGGLILDMFPHWRYMIDALAGEIRSVSAVHRTQTPRRRDERGAAFDVDVEDSVFAHMELEGGAIASVNSSWATRARREFPIQVQVDGTAGSAVAGPFGCWQQALDEAPGGPISAALPQSTSLLEGWRATPVDAGAVNSYRAGWELFLRHVGENGPFPYTLLQGAKGVQLAEAATRSARERRWVDLSPLPALATG
jgi:predicted dehydrogenase